MSNIATTIEQSKHLLELGLEPVTADMSYEQVQRDDMQIEHRLVAAQMDYGGGVIPAWSLSALLELMPKRFDTKCLKLQRGLLTDRWFCEYEGMKFIADYNPIVAAYEMVCWLLKNGFIKKGGDNGQA